MRPRHTSSLSAALLFGLLTPAVALGVPGPPGWREVVQPDGTRLTVRHVGGCDVPRVEDEQGFTIVGWATDEGTRWEYARLDGDRIARTGVLAGTDDPRRLGLSPHLAPPARPRVTPELVPPLPAWPGDHRGAPIQVGQRHTRPLVLLVKFDSGLPVRSPSQTYTPEQFAELLFADQLDAAEAGLPSTYVVSLRDRLAAMSGEQFVLTSTIDDVVGWVTAPQPYDWYVNGMSGAGPSPGGSGDLLHDVAQLVDDQVDFSVYDRDGDGAVDNVILVVEGIGDGALNLFWPHMSSTPDPLVLDGVEVARYVLVTEQNGVEGVGADFGDIHPVGTFAHEFGHLFGLPDLYDTDYTSNGVGAFDLMGYGSWTTQVEPAWMGAWTRALLGWDAAWEQPSGVDDVAFPAVGLGGSAVKLWIDPLRTAEYLLVENRSRIVEPGLPGEGLLVWHVDQDRFDARNAANTVNNVDRHPAVGLLQADGDDDLANARNEGDSGDPFPGATGRTSLTQFGTPNTTGYDGGDSGVRITEISAASDVMSARIEMPDLMGRELAHDELVGSFIWKEHGVTRARVRFEATEPGEVLQIRLFSHEALGSAVVSLHTDDAGTPGAKTWSTTLALSRRGWFTVDVERMAVEPGDVFWAGVDLIDRAVLSYDGYGPVSGHTLVGGESGELAPFGGDASLRVVVRECVDEDGDGYNLCDDDCNDGDATIHPGATELCDGVDQDCDGALPDDEADLDGDGAAACQADCDDHDGERNLRDDDGDGVTSCDGDCDDSDEDRTPGKAEVCDGIDNACAGEVPVDERDVDGDGWSICAGDCDDDDALASPDDHDDDGWSTCDGDCNDWLAAVSPGAVEICNGVDDDCDQQLLPTELDVDRDGQPVCLGDCDDLDPRVQSGDLDGDGYDACAGDCDDLDSALHPEAPERCNGVDDDCDGALAPEEQDFDDDLLRDCEDGDDDGDRVVDGEDPAPLDPFVCGDRDGDQCDDCAVMGASSPNNDGPDADGDGVCDDGGTSDIDGDTVPDDVDPAPDDSEICGDVDEDGCDDCALTRGPPDPAVDGRDDDQDGACDRIDDGCGGGCSSGGRPPPGLAVALLAALAGVRRRR